MKKKGIALLSALMLAAAFGGFATVNASAAVEDVPAPLTVSNVALGKGASFRSLTDMNTVLDAYAYYPDGNGDAFPGSSSGVYNISWGDMNRLTDDAYNWNLFQSHSTAPGVRGWAYIDLGSSYAIDNIKVGYLARWCFSNVVIQVSNDPTFATGVTTVFASTNTLYANDGTTVVYDGGQVGCSLDTKAQTGWNERVGVDSLDSDLLTYTANGAVGRYVRLTNTDEANGGATGETVFNEIQVYAVTSGVVAPKASVASGSYETMTAVELSAMQENAEIYYTLDGSYPTKNSTKYEGAIDASAWTGAVALRAITVVDGKQSAAADYIYKITMPSENVAYGKMASFRSLTDMSEEIAHGSYYPDATGFYGDMFNGNTMAALTDGNLVWYADQNRSPQTRDTHAWVFLDLGSEVVIDNIKVGYLAAWCFENVVIQVSNDPTFATGVTTVFAVTDTVYADDGATVVYNGGQVGCSEETRAQTGWNGQIGVDSVNGGLLTYSANGVSARYVRLTNSEGGNGGAFNVTTICELQVWSKGGANFADPEMKDTVKSATSVVSEMKLTPGTTADEVKAMLPATLGYTTMAGATGEVALTWESADWADMTEGTFTFTATPAIPVDDVFEIVPETYKVSVSVAKADTSALDALIEEVKAMDGAKYTVKTWSPLEKLVAEAKDTVADITVTDITIATYVENIKIAKEALQELATDKGALAQAIATASAMDKANYMSATVVGFDEALAAAVAVNEDADASVAEMTAALNGLNTVLNGLVEKGDMTALTALIAEIKAANYVADNYTEMSYATLVDTLADAEEMTAIAEVAKTEVDAMYAALESAKNGLVAYGDSTQLEALIAECAALVEADYTAGSWAAMTAKSEAAKAFVGEKVMQDVIDGAQADLQAAKDALVSVVVLKAAIASTVDETVYTAISVQMWKDAKAEAQLVLDNANATAEEVADAVAAIETAAAALVEKPVDSGSSSDSEDETSDTTSDVTSEAPETSEKPATSETPNASESDSAAAGCFGVVGIGSAVLTAVGAAALVLKKKED